MADDTESRLRAEIEDLKRKVDEQQKLLRHGAHDAAAPHPPSRRSLTLLALLLAVLIVAAFFKG